jgi:hypothetical protein
VWIDQTQPITFSNLLASAEMRRKSRRRKLACRMRRVSNGSTSQHSAGIVKSKTIRAQMPLLGALNVI